MVNGSAALMVDGEGAALAFASLSLCPSPFTLDPND